MSIKWKSLVLAVSVSLAAAAGTAAAAAASETQSGSIELYVDGERSLLEAKSIDGTPYLTLETAALLGGVVKADKDGKTYTLSAGKKEVRFTIGKTLHTVDGSPVDGTEAPVENDSKVYVPVSWLEEPLGLKIVKDRFTQSVYIFKEGSRGKSAAVETSSLWKPAESVKQGNGTKPADEAKPEKKPEADPSAGDEQAAVGSEQDGDSESSDGVGPEHEAEPGEEAGTGNGPQAGDGTEQAKETGKLYEIPQELISDGKTMLTGISLEGGKLRVETNGSTEANVFSLDSPDRIVIDLPGVSIARDANGKASGTLEVDPDHPYISGIRYSLHSLDPLLARVVVDLKSRQHYSLLTEKNETALQFTEREPFKVMIDAGHGGNDPGAISASGRFEKDFTLPVALKVYDLLKEEALIQPMLIRSDDTYYSPSQRAAMANAAVADLFLSIHANTAPAKSVQGTETYYWREDSRKFAMMVHEALVETIGSPDRQVRKERFVVVKDTVMPAALLELGFISNAQDEAKLYDAKMQDRIAEAIAKSIKQYFDIP